jgi:type I restriction enzyme S subunit
MNATQLLAHFDRLAEAPDAVPRLRRFILDLAVRGKLLEQDEGDEPAEKLFQKVKANQVRLVKGGLIKKSVASDVVEADQQPFVLPNNWKWCRLGDIGDWGSGSTPPRGSSEYYGDDITWLKSGELGDSLALTGSSERVTRLALQKCSFRLNQPGDVLIAMYGATIGKLAILAEEAVTNQAVCGCTPFDGVSNRYLFLFLHSRRADFHNQSEGGAQPNISKVKILTSAFALPPLAEQHRIVAKVDELMALCDQFEAAQQERERRRDRLASASLQRLNQPAADTTPEAQRDHARFHLQHLPRLTTRPEHIKAMRQTFFNLAVCGKLVDQKADDEPIGKLLKRLGLSEIKLPSEANLHVIPLTWAWVTIEQIANVSSGTTPSRDVSDYYSADGTPWVTSGETSNEFIVKTAQHVSDRALRETSLKLYPPGTLIVAMYGQGKTRGQVAELSIAATTNQACAAIVLKLEETGHRRYVKLFFQKIYEEIRELAAGGSQPNLNGGKIKSTLIPLPPLAEQHRIVAKVDELMALCDQLEAQLTTTQNDSRRLLEAVLGAALVPA